MRKIFKISIFAFLAIFSLFFVREGIKAQYCGSKFVCEDVGGGASLSAQEKCEGEDIEGIFGSCSKKDPMNGSEIPNAGNCCTPIASIDDQEYECESIDPDFPVCKDVSAEFCRGHVTLCKDANGNQGSCCEPEATPCDDNQKCMEVGPALCRGTSKLCTSSDGYTGNCCATALEKNCDDLGNEPGDYYCWRSYGSCTKYGGVPRDCGEGDCCRPTEIPDDLDPTYCEDTYGSGWGCENKAERFCGGEYNADIDCGGGHCCVSGLNPIDPTEDTCGGGQTCYATTQEDCNGRWVAEGCGNGNCCKSTPQERRKPTNIFKEIFDKFYVSEEEVASEIYNILFPIGIAIGVLSIVISGYSFLTSQGNPDKVKDAKQRLTSAITGTMFIVLSLVILRVIINTLFLGN